MMNDDYSPRILVVDDDEITIMLVESLLESQGYEVFSANSGMEALEKTRKEYFDLIISDLVMPEMDGNTLVKNIRSMPEYSNVPFVFISGKKEEDIWAQNLKDGADDYLLKPLNKDIFISKIKILLNRSYRNKLSLSTFQKQILEPEKGSVIYCNSTFNSYTVDKYDISFTIYNIFDEKRLFSKLEKENIWAILIDETAQWAIDIVNKLISYNNDTTPVYMFISPDTSESTIKRLYDKHITGYIMKYEDKSLTTREINSRLNREFDLKTKYLHALNKAVQDSPFNSAAETNCNNDKIDINIIHKSFKNIPGGDFYEHFSTPEKNSLTIMGDVMGKNWNAWFIQPAYLAYIKSVIFFHTNSLSRNSIENPQNILTNLNRFINNDETLSDIFSTIAIIGYTYEDNTLHISSAGALRPIYYNKEKNSVEQLNITGTILGVLPEVEYMKLDIKLNKDDKLLGYTDGYSEAKGRFSNKMTGHKTIEKIFKKHSSDNNLTAKEIEDYLIFEENISNFDDDRTMLLLKCRND